MATFLTVLAVVLGAVMLVLVTALFRACVKDSCSRISSGESDAKIAVRKVRKTSRAATFAVRALMIALAAAALCAAAQSLYMRFTGKLFATVGALAVGSGSMSYVNDQNSLPADCTQGFAAGDLIFVERVDEDELSVYDIIAFYSPDGELIIHRIVGSLYSGGQTFYVTRGDANGRNDEWSVSYSSVVGRYTGFKIPAVGTASLFLQSWQGLAAFAVVIYIVCIYDRSARAIENAERERKKYLDAQK
ncbi:MAG TPA: signal peptidase I [Candidatus Coproplasma avicola]|uniref:Signal peptidase I n=1 Tax=Candidatus Coproplasma avicola TaxID=2840744 RepID=A0A9D1J8M4_9FIRM|nr:signal peptidase I [Candidatus Coproplasma avicola]